MKYYLLIFCLSILGSCQFHKDKQSPQREMLPDPELLEHDGYSAENISFKPDTSVNMISLRNNENIEKYLGKDIMTKLNKETDIPSVEVLTKDYKQCLTLSFYPGNAKNEFSEFTISNFKERGKSNQIIINENEFITESGIKLNMTLGNFKTIKGEPDTIEVVNGNLLYKYEISDMKKSDFLKRYAIPGYYAEYLFVNGYLVEFKFGFEYP